MPGLQLVDDGGVGVGADLSGVEAGSIASVMFESKVNAMRCPPVGPWVTTTGTVVAVR